MSEAQKNFGERMQRINPFFSLGKGMELNELNPFAPALLFRVILDIFYRELNEDERRSKRDIVLIVKDILKEMKLSATEQQIERLTYGLLYQGNEELNKPFESTYYDYNKMSWITQTFRYVTMDELYTDLESGKEIIYKLTDIAQEMVFISLEISEEYSISIEQLYSIQLIRNGNFTRATDNQNNLIAKVRRFIRLEDKFRKEVMNDPKILVMEALKQRENKQKEINEQFEEEKNFFKNITSLIEKSQTEKMEESIREELIILEEKVEQSRQLHDRFAKLVINNIALEMRLKTENPALFWDKSIASFKENIYENWVVKQGVTDFSVAAAVLDPLFSPMSGFIFPLDWIWGEQEESTLILSPEEDIQGEQEEIFNRKEIDWVSVIDAWEPVFDQLINTGEFLLTDVKKFSLEVQDYWFYENITYELWMMFDKKPLKIQELNDENPNDEREKLIFELINRDERFTQLYGKEIYTEYNSEEPPFKWYDQKMTAFKLLLKEDE